MNDEVSYIGFLVSYPFPFRSTHALAAAAAPTSDQHLVRRWPLALNVGDVIKLRHTSSDERCRAGSINPIMVGRFFTPEVVPAGLCDRRGVRRSMFNETRCARGTGPQAGRR